MNLPGQRHPNLQKLSLYSLGKLSDDLTPDVENHIADCEECARTVSGLQGDTFTDLLLQYQASDRRSINGSDSIPNAIGNREGELVEFTVRSTGKHPTRLESTDSSDCGCVSLRTALDLPPELRQHGRYHIQECLGVGGMGSVYKAQHRMMNRPVALKVIHPKLISHPGAVDRFQREVQAAARLSHPNIVTAHDADQAGGLHFLVMEYVEGVSLDQILQGQRKLEVCVACEYLRQVALGLQHAHEQGMVHRDIKPHNLMLTGRPTDIDSRPPSSSPSFAGVQVKILDFGLANFARDAMTIETKCGEDELSGSETQLTKLGSMMGTPDYIAPEQAKDAHSADIRSDIYSLGCTFYYLLSGQPPFPEGTVDDKIRAHAEQTPALLREFRDDVPSEVEAILHRMLAKDPADRYQQSADVADDLARFLGTSQPLTRLRILTNTSRRRVWLGLGSLVVLVASVILLVTNNGTLEIRTEVDDVKLIVTRGGQQTEVKDLVTGSTIKRLPNGRYEVKLKDDRNDVQLDNTSFTLSRFGKAVVTITRKPQQPSAEPPLPAIAPFSTAQARAYQIAWAKYLNVDVEFTNSLGMKFVLIPPGEFMMGSTQEKIDAILPLTGDNKGWQAGIKSEFPQHRVIITRPFFLSIHEVTQRQYEQLMGTNPSHFAPTGLGKALVSGLDTANHPVERVSWNAAVLFCAELSQRESLEKIDQASIVKARQRHSANYRLPTEAEWEYACRAGTTSDYWTGETDDELSEASWFGVNSERMTHAVGTLRANPFGLYDIHGNVWEWVNDGWDPAYYQQFQATPARIRLVLNLPLRGVVFEVGIGQTVRSPADQQIVSQAHLNKAITSAAFESRFPWSRPEPSDPDI